jgi:hypothetical protein
MPKEKKLLTPFEMAKINISKTAENFNLYDSAVLLAEAIQSMEKLSSEEKEEIQTMFNSVITEMSLYIEGLGREWN